MGGHLAGSDAQIVIADGEGGYAAALADALSPGHNRYAGRLADVIHNAGVGGNSVIGGDIDHI